MLSNDSDADGDDLSTSISVAPSNGSVTLSGNSYTYTPNADFVGSDSFNYLVSDGNGGTDSALVTITVEASSGIVYASCNLPWDGAVAHGLSVTAYEDDVTYSCTDEVRVCTDGVLSGTYEFENCNEYVGTYNIVLVNKTNDKLTISKGWTVTYSPHYSSDVVCYVVDSNYNNIKDEAIITLTDGCRVDSGSLSTDDTMSISNKNGADIYTVDITEINIGETRTIRGDITSY